MNLQKSWRLLTISFLGLVQIDRIPGKSSLSYADANYPWQMFRDMSEAMVREYQPKIHTSSKPGKYKGKLFSVDSSSIDLCLPQFV